MLYKGFPYQDEQKTEVLAKLLAILLLVVFGHLLRTFTYESTVRHLMKIIGRKQVPKLAEGTKPKTALLKLCYIGLVLLDKMFNTIDHVRPPKRKFSQED